MDDRNEKRLSPRVEHALAVLRRFKFDGYMTPDQLDAVVTDLHDVAERLRRTETALLGSVTAPVVPLLGKVS